MANLKINTISREEFDSFVKGLEGIPNCNINVLYSIYCYTIDGIKQLIDTGVFVNGININPYEIISYCIGEYVFTITNKSKEQLEQLYNDENFINSIASVAADKYISLSVFNHNEKKLTNRYLPPVSSLNLYLNFMLNIVSKFKRNDPQSTLIADLLSKSISYARCILSLINRGYETEAFSNWRTLHECECTLLLLEKYKTPLINRYLRHMQYGIIYQKGDKNDKEGTDIFNEMKQEMAQYNLKSKDIKKFIEYGWLYEIDEVKNNPSFKLNFRDGLQSLAGLSKYQDRYELSSEIIHSTPLLIYSNKQYFYHITLLSLYETFFRLEPIFRKLLLNFIEKENQDRYESFYKMYFTQLLAIYQREVQNYNNWRNNQK